MFIKKCSTANKYLGLPQDIFESIDKTQRNYDTAKILNAMKVFTSLEGEFRYSSQQRILLEAAIVSVALDDSEKKTLIDGQKPVRQAEKAAEHSDNRISAKVNVNNENTGQVTRTAQASKAEESVDLEKKANQIWGFVMSAVISEIDTMGHDSFLKFPVAEAEPKIENGKLIVYFADGQPFNIINKPDNKAFLKKVISDVTDMECEFRKKLVLDEDNTVDYLKSMFGDDITIKK